MPDLLLTTHSPTKKGPSFFYADKKKKKEEEKKKRENSCDRTPGPWATVVYAQYLPPTDWPFQPDRMFPQQHWKEKSPWQNDTVRTWTAAGPKTEKKGRKKNREKKPFHGSRIYAQQTHLDHLKLSQTCWGSASTTVQS